MERHAIVTLEALECYDKKIKDYIDMRCYETIQKAIDLRMDQVEEEDDKDENRYYYPLFERGGL